MLRIKPLTAIVTCIVLAGLAAPAKAQGVAQRLNTTNPYNNQTQAQGYDLNGNRIGGSGRPQADQAARLQTFRSRADDLVRRRQTIMRRRQELIEDMQSVNSRIAQLKGLTERADALESQAASMRVIGSVGSGAWQSSMAAKLNTQGEGRRLRQAAASGFQQAGRQIEQAKQTNERISRADAELDADINRFRAEVKSFSTR